MRIKSKVAAALIGCAAIALTPAIAHEIIHLNHTGTHTPDDGHLKIRHNGHIDHLHDGHLHHTHGDHVDEHVIEVSEKNPVSEKRHEGDKAHIHTPNDGHQVIQHGDHFDHIHDGHLHHMHGDHTDEHGKLDIVK